MSVSEGVREEITRVNEVFAERWNAGDFEGVAALYTKDAVMVPQGSQPIVGREAIRDVHELIRSLGVRRQEYETVMLDGAPMLDELGSTVIEIGVYRCFSGSDDLVDEGNTTLVWKRQEDGSWKLRWDVFHSSRSHWSFWSSPEGR